MMCSDIPDCFHKIFLEDIQDDDNDDDNDSENDDNGSMSITMTCCQL